GGSTGGSGGESTGGTGVPPGAGGSGGSGGSGGTGGSVGGGGGGEGGSPGINADAGKGGTGGATDAGAPDDAVTIGPPNPNGPILLVIANDPDPSPNNGMMAALMSKGLKFEVQNSSMNPLTPASATGKSLVIINPNTPRGNVP